MQWFYKSDGRVLGPLTTAEFKALAEHGHLTPNTLVKQSGDERWVAASHVDGLFQQPQTVVSGDSEPPPSQTNIADVVTAPPPQQADSVTRNTPAFRWPFGLQCPRSATVTVAAIASCVRPAEPRQRGSVATDERRETGGRVAKGSQRHADFAADSGRDFGASSD